MRKKLLISLGITAALGIMLLLPDQGRPETLYRWVNEAGQRCFGDTPPPGAISEFQIIDTRNDRDVKSKEKLQDANLLATAEDELSVDSRNDEENRKARKRMFLKRIEEAKKSIVAIERALVDRPGDDALIKSLRTKRQALMEDFSKLDNI